MSVAIRTGRIGNARDHWREHGSFEGRAGGVLDVVEPRHTRDIEKRPWGVNLYGFLSAVSGLGSHARGSVQALNAQSIPLQIVDVPSWARLGIERRDTIAEPYRVNLIHQNADMMVRFLRAYGKELLNGRYNIGYWLWELPSSRMDWYHTFRYVDEVWVASEFCRHAFQTMTRLPVVRIPLVVDGLDEKAKLGREHFRFPQDVFVFCYIYDISSQLERKNPECVIEAFRQEFGASRDVLLFLKSSNSSHDRVQAARLARMADAPNIRTWDGLMTEEEIVSLHKAIDCFVSPHRAEGFGFNLAEAMYFAKPVIATAYSSNVDFMTEENSYLLDYRLVPVRESAGPYLKGFVWADPSVEHLRQLMRRVFENRAERETKGRKASEEIRNNYSAEAVGRIMRDRFEVLGLDRELIPDGIVVPHMTGTEWPQFSPAGVPRMARSEIGAWEWKPVISILTPVYNVPVSTSASASNPCRRSGIRTGSCASVTMPRHGRTRWPCWRSFTAAIPGSN